MSLSIPGSPYGRWPRSQLDGYAPIPYARHARDYARAVNGRGRQYDEYLVEDNDDGTVTLVPSDAMPYPWRTIWRKRAQEVTGSAAGCESVPRSTVDAYHTTIALA